MRGALLDLCKTEFEYFADVDIILRTSFHPRGLLRLGELLALGRLNLSTRLQIALCANNYAGDFVFTTEVDDFIIHDLDHVKRSSRVDGIYKDVAMYTDGVFRVENGIFILTSGVDDVTIVLYALVDDSFGEGALDGGVVRLYEVVFYELYDEGGLSNRARTENGDLSLLHGGGHYDGERVK